MTNPTSSYEVDTLDATALMGFFQHFSNAYQQIEQSLLMLEIDPADAQEISALKSALDEIGHSLEDIDFNELAKLTQSLKQLLNYIGQGKLQFETVISDIILLAVNDIKTVLEKAIDGTEHCVMIERLPKVCQALELIGQTDSSHREQVIRDTLLLLDPSTEIMIQDDSEGNYLADLFNNSAPDRMELAAYGVEETDDFIFFRGLSEPLETRARYWQGRSERMLRLALKMNDTADRPVDPNQLAAAIYMHDAGMALLPLSIINANGELTPDQQIQVEQHPEVAYELLRYMKDWSEAAQIVLQHHERMDGSGYPNQLKENEICDGAKILAIVDVIDARTHERAHATLMKRPLLRAAMEISKQADRYFSAYWVDIFRQVFQRVRQQDRQKSENAKS
ncbi:MAG: HD domain-containing protein [Gammaproteobacteria bacterium]|nr:HD domain-containing protein [Gammaproteobacteria bacterium]